MVIHLVEVDSAAAAAAAVVAAAVPSTTEAVAHSYWHFPEAAVGKAALACSRQTYPDHPAAAAANSFDDASEAAEDVVVEKTAADVVAAATELHLLAAGPFPPCN